MKFSFKKLRRLLIFTMVVAIFICLIPKLSHASEEFSYKINLQYNVDNSGNTKISENYQIINNTAKQYLTELKVATPTDQVDNLKVNYNDGGSIPFTTEKKSSQTNGYDYQYVQINIKFNRQNVGKGLSWGFTISYDTKGLVDNKGTSHTVYVPAIAKSEDIQDYDITLIAPIDFGDPHPSGAIPTESSKKNNQQIFKFNPRELVDNPISVVFGNSTTYEVNFNFPLNNDTNAEKIFTVALPPDMPNQKNYISSLDPKPTATHLDEDGNILADFKLNAKQKITVKTDINSVVKYLEYDLKASGNKNDIPSSLVQKYTKSTRYWQTNNPDVLVKAKSLSNGNFNVAKAVKDTNKFVTDELSYNNEKIKYNIRQGAANSLKNPNNVVCLEYSDLMIALLRAQGIPARMPIGYAYSSNLKTSDSVADSLHSWVEAYVPNVGWINVDPTWNEKFDNFGKSDMDHLAFAIWGINDDKPTAVSENGVDQNYQYEDTHIKYINQLPRPDLNSKIKLSKFVILPFVSIIKFDISAPSGASGDNYYLKLTSGADNKKIDLGSLAPAQIISSFAFMFGIGSFSQLTGKFGQDNLNLADGMAQPNYLPMVIIIFSLSGFVVYKLIKLVSNKNKQKKSDNEEK